MPSTSSRSAGLAVSMLSSDAMACVRSTSRARLRSSCTICYSNSSIAASSDCGTNVDLLDAREAGLHQDARNVLVHVERFHEELAQLALLDLLFSSAACSLMMLSFQPVSLLASRVFCPPRPIAESFSSATAMSTP